MELEKSTGVQNPLVLLEAMIVKGVDPAALEKMMELSERWQRNQDAKAHADAVLNFQRLCPRIEKGSIIPDKQGNKKYAYADYDDIMRVIQPILSECGIVVTFDSEPVGNNLKTTCFVRVGSHVVPTSVSLPHPQIPNANATQMAGGALAYGQRYSLKAALNIQIAGEDNDARFLIVPISPEQIAEINTLLGECREAGNEVDLPAFLKYIGVENLGELPQSKFELAKFELNRKKKAVKK